MSFGKPNYNTPKFVKQHYQNAVLEECNHYYPGRGVPALRKVVAEDYTVKFGRYLDYEKDVLIGSGAWSLCSTAISTFI
jgi:aspartate/methionine/tyrosine aminotransferase